MSSIQKVTGPFSLIYRKLHEKDSESTQVLVRTADKEKDDPQMFRHCRFGEDASAILVTKNGTEIPVVDARTPEPRRKNGNGKSKKAGSAPVLRSHLIAYDFTDRPCKPVRAETAKARVLLALAKGGQTIVSIAKIAKRPTDSGDTMPLSYIKGYLRWDICRAQGYGLKEQPDSTLVLSYPKGRTEPWIGSIEPVKPAPKPAKPSKPASKSKSGKRTKPAKKAQPERLTRPAPKPSQKPDSEKGTGKRGAKSRKAA